jgi:hypothetical protein
VEGSSRHPARIVGATTTPGQRLERTRAATSSRRTRSSSTHRRRRSSGHSSFGGGADDGALSNEQAPDDEQSYSTIRPYLTDFDESPEAVRDVQEILGDPSNIVNDPNSISLLAWDVRDRAPHGSYLYVLQQDVQNHISQIHRFFCRERRLDILAESCEPVASIFSDSGIPMSVGYSQEGQPILREADDLDQSLFSRSNNYVEANEMLLYLQEYFDDLRA